MTGVIGYDETGNVLKTLLHDKGMTTDGIFEEEKRPTTLKTRIYAHDQQVVRFDRESKKDISRSTRTRILDYVRACLPEIKGIIISDYCKGVITRNLIKNILHITENRIFIAVDPKIGHFDYYKGASLITPNIHEASFGSGIKIMDEQTLREAGRVLLKKLQLRSILITQGDNGMTLFEKNGKITHIPTLAKEVYDVTGAGDTVISVFTLCHASGLPLREAADIANHAAGNVVGKRGNAVVTPEDILESIRENRHIRNI